MCGRVVWFLEGRVCLSDNVVITFTLSFSANVMYTFIWMLSGPEKFYQCVDGWLVEGKGRVLVLGRGPNSTQIYTYYTTHYLLPTLYSSSAMPYALECNK